MQEANQQVSDVEFTETPKADKPAEPAPFMPAVFLTQALIEAGYPEPTAWMKDIDPLVETHEDEKQRIFFANRALRLFLAEIPERDNITPRMVLADGIDSIKWSALMTQGIIPWLMNEFDEKTGKRKKKDAVVGLDEAAAGTTDQTTINGQLVESTDEAAAQTPPWEDAGEGERVSPVSVTKGQVGDSFVEQPPVWGDVLAVPEKFPPAEPGSFNSPEEVDPQANMGADAVLGEKSISNTIETTQEGADAIKAAEHPAHHGRHGHDGHHSES